MEEEVRVEEGRVEEKVRVEDMLEEVPVSYLGSS